MTEPPKLVDLAALQVDPEALCTAFALLQRSEEVRTKQQQTFLDIRLRDAGATVAGRIWPEAPAMAALRGVATGTVLKVLFTVGSYQGHVQVNVHNARPVAAGEPGYDPAAVYGAGHRLAGHLLCRNLAFDIETAPVVDRRALPPTVAEALARHAERTDADEAKAMGLSPFFAGVVSLAVADADADATAQRVTVFVVPPKPGATLDAPEWVRPVSEPELLQAWWTLAAAAEAVVSFNGRGFDVPFLIARSLIHRVPARVDLLGNRYGLRPHLDLYRVLTHGERSLGPTNLDVVCWALGIPSPKETMDGSMVASAYERGDLLRIAEYNAHDVRATTAVYRAVRDGVLRYREDW